MMFPASVLHTNYCPTEAEVRQLRQLVAEPTTRLAALAQKIAVLQSQIDALQAEHDALKSHLDAHNALLSPFRRLPVEIAQRIFLECLPKRRNCVMSAEEAPLLLTRVCCSWRKLAHGCPRLWSRLHIYLPTPPLLSASSSGRALLSQKIDRRLAGVRFWLGLARECPLSISLHATYWAGDSLMGMLVPLSTRWEHLAVAAPASVLYRLQTLRGADVPCLKSLLIKPLYDDIEPAAGREYSSDWKDAQLLGAPRLSRLSLALREISLHELPICWDNIAELSVDYIWGTSAAQAVKILARCARLEICRIWVDDTIDMEHPLGPASVPVPPSTVVKQETIQTLLMTFVGDSPVSLNYLSKALVLPHLRDFRCSMHATRSEVWNTIGTRSPAPLAALIFSSPKLLYCEIDSDLFASQASLLEFIRALPAGLRVLELYEAWGNASWPMSRSIVDKEVLSLFLPTGGFCCPALEALVFRHCASFTELNLMELVRTRMVGNAAAATLRRLVVHWGREMLFDVGEELGRLHRENANMDVRLLYPPEASETLEISPWEGLDDFVGWT
ncbi:hypothetical protein MKEN_00242100 [Mycena kentingensis (nom. inval.)]|nr:hypothetical protein MKEN_00242100 [Mycena kentingensis (nom. inval.)]